MSKQYLLACTLFCSINTMMFASKIDFWQACYANQLNTIEAIASENSDAFNQLLQTTNIHQETPLHLAAERGNLEMVKFFLKHGLSPTAQDTWGRTTLHHAANHNHVPMIKVLIRAGADTEIEAHDKKKPYAYQYLHVGEKGYEEADELLTMSRNEVQKIHTVDNIVKTYGVASQEFQDFLTQINVRDYTPLHEAVINTTCTLYLEVLLEYRANPDIANNSDFTTPLHQACLFHNVQAVKVLLQAGANPNAKTRIGTTPLGLIKGGGYLNQNYTDENKAAIIKLLREKGAV